MIFTYSCCWGKPKHYGRCQKESTVGDCKMRYKRAVVKRSALLSRSEEHTSELQSRPHLVCRLLLEKKKKKNEQKPAKKNSRTITPQATSHIPDTPDAASSRDRRRASPPYTMTTDRSPPHTTHVSSH